MFLDFMLSRFEGAGASTAIVWKDKEVDYAWLLARVAHWRGFLDDNAVAPGTVTALEADFSPDSVALFLALLDRGCVLVPLTTAVGAQKPEFLDIAQCEVELSIDASEKTSISRTGRRADHPFYERLRQAGHPGLVLFSSGSTGKSKAAVHDMVPMLDKFKVSRNTLRGITFLLYDHIGGVNTLLYQLSNVGRIVTVAQRTPDAVLAAVEKHQVELLPTTPTFINLILLSEAYKRHDLRSLKIVTYGTEPMQETTLRRFHELHPWIRLQQTYGLSELGILRSKSKDSNSLWVQVGGEGFETRVVEGILQIKAKSAMLGYLNAESPFTEDGWFNTGDLVEVDGPYLRILGRKSEIINVGGEKVFPAEVESAILELDNVSEAVVYGEKNLITGSIVCAEVRLKAPEDPKALAARLKKHCLQRLKPYKVPVKVRVNQESLHGARYKLVRNRVAA